jgi:hypothetical protein
MAVASAAGASVVQPLALAALEGLAALVPARVALPDRVQLCIPQAVFVDRVMAQTVPGSAALAMAEEW